MLRVAICDDDWYYCEKIKSMLLEKFPEMKGTIEDFADGSELIDDIKSGNNYRIIIMDKEMKELDGISTAEYIRKMPGQQETLIIFVTAYDSEIVPVVNVHPFAYIKKPVEKNELIEKMRQALESIEKSGRCIILKQKNGDVVLNPMTLYCIESVGRHCLIYDSNGTNEYMITMKNMMNIIKNNTELFIRVHKSYSINIKYLERLTTNSIYLKNGLTVPIGRKFKKELFEKYIRNFCR